MNTSTICQSKNMSSEYCCTVVKLGEIQEIPGAVNIAKTTVNGRTIVISKERKMGDIMIYASNESALCHEFLYENNLHDCIELNKNFVEVKTWLETHKSATEEETKEYLRTKKGYFGKEGRIRMKKLGGELSMGFLFEPELISKWAESIGINLVCDFESMVGTDFDSVGDRVFIKAYVPERKPRKESKNIKNKQLPKIYKEFDRLVPGQFNFHYDTQLFEKSISRFHLDDSVTITLKMHGTSFILSNVISKVPVFGGFYEKLFPSLPKWLQWTKKGYAVLYSSRRKIQNEMITNKKPKAYNGLEICYNYWYEALKDYIPEGITVYGEIIGYIDGTKSFIQKIGNGYDYGCKPGVSNFMIYRVNYKSPDGVSVEYDIKDVITYTNRVKELLNAFGKKDIASRIVDLKVLYSGKIKDMYPGISSSEDWRKELLEKMKNDKTRFGMELKEPLCKNPVYREGIVIRIDGDPMKEAFKLKCVKFLEKEAKCIDMGEMNDAEIDERYS